MLYNLSKNENQLIGFMIQSNTKYPLYDIMNFLYGTSKTDNVSNTNLVFEEPFPWSVIKSDYSLTLANNIVFGKLNYNDYFN